VVIDCGVRRVTKKQTESCGNRLNVIEGYSYHDTGDTGAVTQTMCSNNLERNLSHNITKINIFVSYYEVRIGKNFN
jgi:hypothetical protein